MNSTRYLGLLSYVQGAMQAFMLLNTNNDNQETLFLKAIRLMVTEHWCLPLFRSSVVEVLQKFNITSICFKCGGDIKEGQALENTWVGTDDFGNDAGQPGTTISKIGPPVMKNVCKCKSCGHSFTI